MMNQDSGELKKVPAKEISNRDWPEKTENFMSRWSYSYLNSLLSKGAKETLTMNDLWKVPAHLHSPTLSKQFNSLPAQDTLKTKLWHIISSCFIPAGFFQLVTVACQCCFPLLGMQLIRLLETHPENLTQQGIVIAFTLFILVTANGVATQRHEFLGMQAGMMVRTTVNSAIYATALNLSPKGKIGLTTGEVTNLVAVDSQKLFEVVQDGHLLWSCPLSMTIVTVLLIYVQGPVTIVGMVILFMMVPTVKLILGELQKARKERVRYSDDRTQTATAMINGIQVTKLNSYEKKFEKKITEKRRMEMKYLRKELMIWAMTQVAIVSSPILATGATFIVYVYTGEGNVLTASDTFTTLMLFSVLRFPINYAGRLIGRLGQSLQAAERIALFLSREVHKKVDKEQSQKKSEVENIVNIKDGTFSTYNMLVDSTNATNETDPKESSFTLSGIDFSIRRGDVMAVVGPVGSGKSTLALSLLREIPSAFGTSFNVQGRIGYSSQLPFILNATLRENILFGHPYDPVRYDRVIEACCLQSDIDMFQAGDLTEIGERGVTLSGGQKQRLSIARTVYAMPDIAIFDDPLSALDAGTSRAVCERLFLSKSNDGLLSKTAVVLVTHSTYFLHQVDQILVLENGRSIFHGTWDALIQVKQKINSPFIDSLSHGVQEKGLGDDNIGSIKKSNTHELKEKEFNKNSDDPRLMTVEEREFGTSSLKTWKQWFLAAGGWTFLFFQVILLTIDRVAYVATEWWLAHWTEAANGSIIVFGQEFPSQFDGIGAQTKYVIIYVIIICVSVTSTASRTIWAVLGGARCANKLFGEMTITVLQAPMSFFETTPLGRVLNRFTYDTEILDIELSQAMSYLVISFSWFFACIGVMTSIVPWLILVLLPIIVLYYFIQLHYRKSSVDLKRLDSTSRSPIQTVLYEVVDGATTIRVFEQEQNFTTKFFDYMDRNNTAMLTFIAAQKWISLRIEILSAIIQLIAVLLIVILEEYRTMKPGFAAMLIIWTTNFTITLNFLLVGSTEAEAAITSVERIKAMCALPQENHSAIRNVPQNWPSDGSLIFKDVHMRYRNNLPYALKGLTFTLPSGKRCGVIGRTGAGKSSLAVALFRLVEIEKGEILLDGVNLSHLKLSEIRGRSNCMSIIPQDPVLFAGSVRDCLDPFNEWPDDDILGALEAVRLLKPGRGVDALDDQVAEGGSNYSVGERQLLCMARALLAKPKFLVLDEATASVDGETDAFIQNMLRTRFEGCTLLTIAHRLNTIMDYDLIIAMDSGKVAEIGSPKSLLQNKDGLLSQLVDATGEESAASLRTMVR